MQYTSTRDNNTVATASTAIALGLSKEGGLFVPETVPTLTEKDFETLKNLDYVARAEFILKGFLTDFTQEEISRIVRNSVSRQSLTDNGEKVLSECIERLKTLKKKESQSLEDLIASKRNKI